MADIKISELNEIEEVEENDYLVTDNGEETNKVKKKNLFAGVYGLPAGGTTHQIPWKKSGDDGDVEFHTLVPSDIGIGTVFTLKGSKPNPQSLPTTGNVQGDVWYVESQQVGYIWIEKQGVEEWEMLGMPIDLSNYVQKVVDATLNNIALLNADGTYKDGGVGIVDEVDEDDENVVTSGAVFDHVNVIMSGHKIVELTQTQYDDLETKDDTTIYLINGD